MPGKDIKATSSINVGFSIIWVCLTSEPNNFSNVTSSCQAITWYQRPFTASARATGADLSLDGKCPQDPWETAGKVSEDKRLSSLPEPVNGGQEVDRLTHSSVTPG